MNEPLVPLELIKFIEGHLVQEFPRVKVREYEDHVEVSANDGETPSYKENPLGFSRTNRDELVQKIRSRFLLQDGENVFKSDNGT